MGNTFKSLVAAAGILAAGGTNSKAEGGLDTRVEKTKQALVELIGSLDPDAYGKAIEVLQSDLGLLTDGRLDSTDEPTIGGHMTKLAKLFPEETDKVLKAMNEVDTIVAADQVAALNESPEERRERLAREKEMEERAEKVDDINKKFFDEKNWTFPGNEKMGEVKDGRSNLEVKFTSTDTTIKRADLSYESGIIGGKYQINLQYSGDGTVGFWTYDGAGRQIKIDNTDRIFLDNGINTINLPEGVKRIRFFLATTPDAPWIKVTSFNIGIQ